MKSVDWSVSLSGLYVQDGDPRDPDDVALDLAEALSEHQAAVGHRGQRFSVTLTLRAADVDRAFRDATKIVVGTLRRLLPGGRGNISISSAEAITHADLAVRLAKPTIPPLVGVHEAAEILGVSKQRIADLAATSKSFPRPVAQLAGGRIWPRSAIEAFRSTRTGKPGRPRSSATPARKRLSRPLGRATDE